MPTALEDHPACLVLHQNRYIRVDEPARAQARGFRFSHDHILSSQQSPAQLVAYGLEREMKRGMTIRSLRPRFYSIEVSRANVRRSLAANVVITAGKATAFALSGSGALLGETLHSAVDSANQALLLLGLRSQERRPDSRFNYGQKRGAFYYSLLSALGMFYAGACVSVWHGCAQLVHAAEVPHYSLLTYSVLAGSFAVDSWVLWHAVRDARKLKPLDTGWITFLRSNPDPFLAAVIVEDVAATLGVAMASIGVGLSHYTGNGMYDALSCVGVGLLMGGSALSLVRLNREFLLGRAVDPELEGQVRRVVAGRAAVERVSDVQSRYEGPFSFGWKGALDFDGRVLAGRLRPDYATRLGQCENDEQRQMILSRYAEDVTRAVERETAEIQDEVRKIVPQCEFIELTPLSARSKYMDEEDQELINKQQ